MKFKPSVGGIRNPSPNSNLVNRPLSSSPNTSSNGSTRPQMTSNSNSPPRLQNTSSVNSGQSTFTPGQTRTNTRPNTTGRPQPVQINNPQYPTEWKQNIHQQVGQHFQEYSQNHRPPWMKKPLNPQQEANAAAQLYANARLSDLPIMLLGKADIRTDTSALHNFGTSAGKPMLPSQPGGASNTTGSILNQDKWWPLQNDAWLLGGAHGNKQFHVALSDLKDEHLWDAKNNRPTVLGRELLGLKAMGYRTNSQHAATFGHVLMPPNVEDTTRYNLGTILNSLQGVTGPADIRNRFNENPFPSP